MNNCSRRNFLYMTGAGALAGAASRTSLYGQQEIPAPVPAPSIFPYESRSPVSLVKGDDRRKNITEALLAMDKEIGPAIKRKKYVVIKINNVATNNQLAATHVDALRGILDYLARNLNTGGHNETETKFVSARQVVYHDKQHPSHVLLPVIPVEELKK